MKIIEGNTITTRCCLGCRRQSRVAGSVWIVSTRPVIEPTFINILRQSMWTAEDTCVRIVRSSVLITNHWRTINPIVLPNNKVPPPNTATANCINIADVLGEILKTLISPCHGGGWRCLSCGKTAKTKQHIKNHAEIHVDGFSNICPFCSKEFKTSNVLQNHISLKHKNANDYQ